MKLNGPFHLICYLVSLVVRVFFPSCVSPQIFHVVIPHSMHLGPYQEEVYSKQDIKYLPCIYLEGVLLTL